MSISRLPIPGHGARATFELCADYIQDDDFRERLRSVVGDIEAADAIYKELGTNGTLFKIVEANAVAGRVTAAEMKKLYKETFSRPNTATREIYDQIKAAPANSICPLCGHRIVATLDHYLAQSRHPALAVNPLNLVPACSDCNKLKHDKQPCNASDQTLHPYFDEVDDEVWLVATVKEVVPPVLTFCPLPPLAWPPIKQSRLHKHFSTFELARLYSIQAAVELVIIRDYLQKTAERAGAAGLRKHLEEQAETRRHAANNSWQSATYEALAKSDWFCTDGFTTIPRQS